MRPRRSFEPAVRVGVAEGHAMARSGELTERAAKAARGRRHPAQRRAKTLAALGAVSDEARAEGNRRRHLDGLRTTVDVVAARMGLGSFGAFVVDRVSRGDSLAATSREAGLHKDWLSRHLAAVAPEVAASLDGMRPDPVEERVAAAVLARGFGEVRAYLAARHTEEHCTVAAMAAELAVSRSSVEAAMRRHGVERTAHVASRAVALSREAAIAQRLGVDSLREHVGSLRAQGVSWAAIAQEVGVSPSWLRRRAASWTS